MKIMAHTVIGYPTIEKSRKIVDQYVNANFEILELQIPFSHPTADGSVLTQANQIAAEHTSVSDSFSFLQEVKQDYPLQEIMAMTYLNKVFAYGIKEFCEQLSAVDIAYLIVPDLPFDSPFAKEIHQHPKVQLVPVLSANVGETRLEQIMDLKPDYLYVMADYKITGSTFSIHPKIKDLIARAKSMHPCKVGLGFGISTKEQVNTVLEVADFAIMGTALMRAVNDNAISEKLLTLI